MKKRQHYSSPIYIYWLSGQSVTRIFEKTSLIALRGHFYPPHRGNCSRSAVALYPQDPTQGESTCLLLLLTFRGAKRFQKLSGFFEKTS